MGKSGERFSENIVSYLELTEAMAQVAKGRATGEVSCELSCAYDQSNSKTECWASTGSTKKGLALFCSDAMVSCTTFSEYVAGCNSDH